MHSNDYGRLNFIEDTARLAYYRGRVICKHFIVAYYDLLTQIDVKTQCLTFAEVF